MLNLITKTKILLKENRQKEFFDTSKAYIRYIFLSAWFKISLKETNPELKKVNKNWIIYTYLKTKYSSFLKKIQNKGKYLARIFGYSMVVLVSGRGKSP